MTPHARHLREMRASIAAREMLVTDTRAWLESIRVAAFKVPREQLRELAKLTDEARRLRQCYPDPTRRHRAEMALSILEQRHADGLIDAREVRAVRKAGRRG